MKREEQDTDSRAAAIGVEWRLESETVVKCARSRGQMCLGHPPPGWAPTTLER